MDFPPVRFDGDNIYVNHLWWDFNLNAFMSLAVAVLNFTGVALGTTLALLRVVMVLLVIFLVGR